MNYQKLIIVGNATDDAQWLKSKTGKVSFTTFSVAVNDSKDRTTFFPVAVFGKYGEAVAKHITKGRRVLVEGRISVSAKGRFNVVAERIAFGAQRKEK
ncbi:MAG: single-stranded DNA-binding protein [Nitrososphaera sp.]|nr:single-stranded DNA-binding protein [Nitrososphaera sp.]